MANIKTAQSLIVKARALREAGEYSSAAACAVAAQREASQCRAQARADAAWSAHNIIASCQMRATEQRDKSNIGRAMAESRMIGWVF